MAKAVGEKREAWKMIEGMRERERESERERERERERGATANRLKAPVWPDEDGSQEGSEQSTEGYGERTVPKA